MSAAAPAMRYLEYESPLGPIRLVGAQQGLAGVYFIGQRHEAPIGAHWEHRGDDPLLLRACAQIDAYFAGRLKRFELPLAPSGTEFQQRVWRAIGAIEFGRTITYADLALNVGHAKAVRAAGAATGRNPISIIVPCHRVLGSDRSLTGYAGGVDRKLKMLRLEGIDI